MNSIFPWLGIAVLILCGWAIVKKYQVNMVLLLGGLILNLLAFWGGAEIFPKKFSATGIVGFDLIELLRTISVSQVSGVGFLIFISGGFAAYMQAIGASDRFVTVCAKPLSLIKNPYLILAAVFIVGHCLGLVITSAAGLAMLMVVTVYPLIIRVGCSPLAAAAVVASVLAIGYAPASGTANFASELVHLDPIEYLVRYQKREKLEQTPAFYACLPLLPIALLLVFNKFVWGVSMNVATAMFIAWIASFFIDLITRRNIKESFDLSFAMFKGMGSILTSTVGLIFVAAFFAKGLQNIGIVALLMHGADSIGLGYTGSSVVLSAIVGVITVLTGSGVAAFTSLGQLVPAAAQSFGENGISMMLMMHTASEMLRAMSPVAGVIIIVAGFAKVNPLTMVKRTIVPCLTGYVVMLITVSVLF